MPRDYSDWSVHPLASAGAIPVVYIMIVIPAFKE